MWLIIVLLALWLDSLLGEPRRFHPLVGFGDCGHFIERYLNWGRYRMALGFVAVSILLVPAAIIYALQQFLASQDAGIFIGLYYAVDLVILYLVIGKRALTEHAQAVAKPLLQADMATARLKLSYMVSRDTEQMSSEQITSSVIESVLENGNDAIFAALFWYLIGGAPAAVAYRSANTLDAMWGYRTERFNRFGYAAAKLDDLFNYLPSRISALFFVLLGHSQAAWSCWRQQAAACASPNGGVVMTSGAGALMIKIGGPTVYFGQLQHKLQMGQGKLAQPADIERAITLVGRTTWCWCGLALLCWLAIYGLRSLYV